MMRDALTAVLILVVGYLGIQLAIERHKTIKYRDLIVKEWNLSIPQGRGL